MSGSPKNIFFLGKGGVGKSTVSSLFSILLSRKGKKLLLVSMDPAHNLSDIFDKQFSEKPTTVIENLTILEINLQKWIRKYLSGVEKQMQNNFRYLSALNLENHFSTIRHAPGIEEYALLLAFSDIRKRFQDCDFLIFDMPPTALALKFFNLPYLSLIWLRQLTALRDDILRKKQIIHKIKLGSKTTETDKLIKRLSQQTNYYQELSEQFANREQTFINLVMNADKLAVNESQFIIEHLREFNIQPVRCIVNKLQKEADLDFVKHKIPEYPVHPLVYADFPLTTQSALDRYLEIPSGRTHFADLTENL